jgi:hypothetical protein
LTARRKTPPHDGYGVVSVFDWRWPQSERGKRRSKIRRDRKYLEPRSRRFLKIFLNAGETRKPAFYKVLNEASRHCFPTQSGLPSPDLDDTDIAEATSNAAMKVVLETEVFFENVTAPPIS